jgi:hypothetical protein
MVKDNSNGLKWYWKILIGFGSLLLLAVMIDVGLNIWVKSQLPKIINKENDSAYHITYKNLDVSIWSGYIKMDDIVILPKTALKDSLNKAGIYAKVKAVEVRNFKVWSLLFSDKLKAKSITVEQPNIILYQKDKKENIKNAVVAPFEKIVSVTDIFLNHGEIKIINVKDNNVVLTVNNINLNLDGIVITEKILDNKIPFKFNNYKVSCDSLFFHPNEFYHIKTNKLTSTKSDLKIDKFRMLPTLSRREFVSKIPAEKDIYTLLCDSVSLTKIDWGFKADDFFFHCNTVDLNHISANIYRSKEPADDLTKKFLYNKLLREMKFDLKVNTLKIRNSLVEYEEEKLFENGAGKVIFSSFNLTATSVNSGFKKDKLPDLNIKVNCRFMNASPLNVTWKLNVMDKSEGFNINGSMTNFDAEKMVIFTKPYMNVTAKGILDQVYFNFAGNDKKMSGELAVEYDDLKFTIYKKDDRKKKNKLLTFVAKIFVKKDTKDKVKDAKIEIERIPEKSFYNFLWRGIAEGLIKILV